MDILPIQGLAVPCERVFSSAKETMSARQNHILPEPYLAGAYGSTSNAQIFGAERLGFKFHRGLGQGV